MDFYGNASVTQRSVLWMSVPSDATTRQHPTLCPTQNNWGEPRTVRCVAFWAMRAPAQQIGSSD